MLKFLKSVVGSGDGIKDLPYTIGEPYSTAWGGWTHFRGTSKVLLFFSFLFFLFGILNFLNFLSFVLNVSPSDYSSSS